MGKSDEYKEAQQASTDALKASQSIANQAYLNSQGYVGDAGYQRALDLGQEGAVQSAGGAVSSAQGASRASGMNQAQAAAIGANTGQNAYTQGLANQQNMAYQSGMDAVGAEQARAGNYQSNAGQSSSNFGQQQGQYNTDRDWWTNLGSSALQAGTAAGTALLSDERCKDIHEQKKEPMETIREIASVGAYDFNYKGDNKEHLGVMAQELEQNDLLKGAVIDGDVKMLDTKELTANNTAILSEMAKAILELNQKIDSLRGN